MYLNRFRSWRPPKEETVSWLPLANLQELLYFCCVNMKIIGRKGMRNLIIFQGNFYASISLWIPPSSLRISVIVVKTRLPTTFIETRTLILSRPGLANLTHRRATQVIKDSLTGRTFVYIFYIESGGGLNSL